MHFWKLARALPSVFSSKDIQKVLKIQAASAKVLCTRYTKKGDFIRLRPDLYVFKEVFIRLDQKKMFYLTALIQKQTYVSFSSALASRGLLVASPDYIEAATFKRSTEKQIGHMTFKYHHLPEKIFSSTARSAALKNSRVSDSIVASAEKAFLDVLYLYSLGRYYIDLKKINLEALSYNKLAEMCVHYPIRTQKLLGKLYGRAFNI